MFSLSLSCVECNGKRGIVVPSDYIQKMLNSVLKSPNNILNYTHCFLEVAKERDILLVYDSFDEGGNVDHTHIHTEEKRQMMCTGRGVYTV